MFRPNRYNIIKYSPYDSTVKFYNYINTLINENSIVVDFGAGRGSWLEEDSKFKINLRTLKGKVKKVIGIDIDSIVLENKSTDNNIVYKDTIPLEDNSVDLIIMDWVFENILLANLTEFAEDTPII
jgi:23S rRNA U2552 (ribose-2'-O)-methylase RlmE/FtsJ